MGNLDFGSVKASLKSLENQINPSSSVTKSVKSQNQLSTKSLYPRTEKNSSTHANRNSTTSLNVNSSFPSLFEISLRNVAHNIKHVHSLECVPDEIVLLLFWETLRLGNLTESVLKMFLNSNHELMLGIIKKLEIKSTLAPILPTQCGMNPF